MPEQLNGIELAKLNETLQRVGTSSKTTDQLNRWTARVRWLSGFRSKVFVRNHSFLVDEVADLAGVDVAPNAVEYVMSALGACLSTGFVLNATKRGIRIDDLEISLDGKIDNILTFLGLSKQGHPGYEEIRAKLYVRADADEKSIREIWSQTLETSPVANTLVRNVNIIADVRLIS